MAEHFSGQPAHAYILIEVTPSETRRVVEQLRTIPGTLVREVLGPYDIVVEVEADAPEYITSILREKIRPMRGVLHTVTCTWIE